MDNFKKPKGGLGSFSFYWRKLEGYQKVSALMLMVLLLALPLAVLITLGPVRIFPRAKMVVTPPMESPLPTPTARLQPTQIPVKTPFLPTPTARIVPTPTASGTPSPIFKNQRPIITTTSFPEAKVGKKYFAEVTGYDPDKGDNLKMEIKGLPAGIALIQCRQPKKTGLWKYLPSKNTISCTISGTPKLPGIYNVGIILSDSKGGIAQAILRLKVAEGGGTPFR